MTEPTCRWVSTTQPRVLSGRHLADCEDETCRGCQPCEAQHCRVCGVAHEVCCPRCRDEARTNLEEIRRMCGDLPAEVEHRGVEGEAFNLLGPVADPEAWGHRQASARVGRIDQAWLEDADDERHPLTVLATWEDVWRDALDHETDERASVARSANYLGWQLTHMAANEHVPFEDFARDLRGCVSHLEDVLRDGKRDERTRVTCDVVTCKKRPRLIRQANDSGLTGNWVCPACNSVYDDGAFRDAHAKQLRHAGAAKYLPQADVLSTLVSQGRSERTARKWLEPPLKHAKDECSTCGKTYRPNDWTVCPRDGGELRPVTVGDPEAVVNGYCDLRTHKTWLWWPDMWRLHVSVKKRKRAA